MKVLGEAQIQFLVIVQQLYTVFMESTGLTALDKMLFFTHRQATFLAI